MGPSERSAQAPLGVEKLRPAYEQVAGQLRALIVRGEIVAGDRLPSEQELCVLFGVSRGTVREALRSLASQGLLRSARGVGGGTFVVQPSPTDINNYLEMILGLLDGSDELSLDDLWEAREFFEVPAAGLAAQRRTDDDMRAINGCLNLDPGGSDEHRRQSNLDFHRSVSRAGGNRLLEVVSQPVFTVLSRRTREVADASFWDRIDRAHEQIAMEIEAQNPEGAAAAMAEHLADLRNLDGSLTMI